MSRARPLRVLLVKPYQPVTPLLCQPPLGLLYLISCLRERFGTEVEARYWDLRLFRESPERFAAAVAGRWDLVGISALNYEAEVSHRLARELRRLAPGTVIALGGPYAHSSPSRARREGGFDWVFDGESERSFPAAVAARFFGEGRLEEVAGLSWRPDPSGEWAVNGGSDPPEPLDALPLPAWDQVPFDLYARRGNMNGPLRAARYAPLFTSRGCPYKCHYCHDIFGKAYRWRSAGAVADEIDLLVRRYGVGEFQIIDDIYNLHKPRMREIARLVLERHGRGLRFNFPNGVRADIIDPDDLPLLREMGVYQMCVAIETATPRLQRLIEKDLDVERARRVVEAAAGLGITVKGFFMIGFPTETLQEIERTVRLALDSKLTFAGFYLVIPQEGTPIHDLARRECAPALEEVALQDFYAERPWYQAAYGVDMRALQRSAMRRFYLRPRRVARLLRNVTARYLLDGAWILLKLAVLRGLPFSARWERLLEEGRSRRAQAARSRLHALPPRSPVQA